jgi:hypothetical protein
VENLNPETEIDPAELEALEREAHLLAAAAIDGDWEHEEEEPENPLLALLGDTSSQS